MMRLRKHTQDNQAGFSLIEILVSILIGGMLLGLSAQPLRNYWLTRSLDTAAGESVAQMEQLQERVVSETHPLVYGMRFRVGTSEWAIVRFNPGSNLTSNADDTCTLLGATRTFANVTIDVGTTFADSGRPTELCAGALGSSYKFAFFFAKGSATAGDLYLTQPSVGKSKHVRVIGLTGRAEEV